jgi:PBP1b-binding outer membrane lipoprotein LpoB
MRRVLTILAVLALLTGCSHKPKAVVEPAPAQVSTDVDTTQSNPPEPRKAPSSSKKKTAHAQAPAKPAAPPPAPAATPNDGVVAGSSTSAPVDTVSTRKEVVPQLTEGERRELEKTSREQIDAARTKLSSLDAAKLDADKQRKLLIAQGFLSDAIAARTQQDWMRASQLATKAKVLADELTAN